MNLAGSQTEKNLLTAFAGESQARNRYTYFAGQAKKDGFVQIAQIFEETANQEKEHAKRFFKFLEGGEVEIQCAFPAGVIGSTAENLAAAAGGEQYEWTTMYQGSRPSPKRKGSRPSPPCSRESRSPRSSTSAGTAGCWGTSKKAGCSSGPSRSFGAA